jgi:hypothetical protein
MLVSTTMVYFDKTSKAYTVQPVLTMRQSLAKLRRSKPVTYRPSFSDVDLEEKPEIVLGVFAQIQKSETFMRIKTLEEDAPELEPTADKRIAGGEYRFPAKEIQFVCLDLQERHSSALNDLLNNSVFMAPFHGTLACTFCPSNMKPRSYRGLQDMILHIMKHHCNLLRSWFACPACMKPHVMSYHQYISHWEDQHAAVTGLIVRLDETNVSSRLGWGLALLSVFQVCSLLKVANWHDPMETESESVITSIGGYALKNKMSPIQLRDAITRARFAGIEDPDLKRQLYQKWQADRRREETPAPATPSTSNGASYAAAVNTRPARHVPYEPRVPEVITLDLEPYRRSHQASPQPRDKSRGEKEKAATPAPAAAAPRPSLLAPAVTQPTGPRLCNPTVRPSTSKTAAAEFPALPPPGATAAPPGANIQPRPSPLPTQPKKQKTVVIHHVTASEDDSASIRDLADQMKMAAVSSSSPQDRPISPEPLPPGLEDDPLGINDCRIVQLPKQKKKKKAKRAKRDRAHHLQDEVAGFPDTPEEPDVFDQFDTGSDTDSSVDNGPAAHALLDQDDRRDWNEDVNTPLPYQPQSTDPEWYSPTRVSSEAYHIHGYEPHRPPE